MLSAGTGTDAIGHIADSTFVSPNPLVAPLDTMANGMDYERNRSAEEREISSSTGYVMPDADSGIYECDLMLQTASSPDKLLDEMSAGGVSAYRTLNQDEITSVRLNAGTGREAIGHNSASTIVSPVPLVAPVGNIANGMNDKSNHSAKVRIRLPSIRYFMPRANSRMYGSDGTTQTARSPNKLLDLMLARNVSADRTSNQNEITSMRLKCWNRYRRDWSQFCFCNCLTKSSCGSFVQHSEWHER